MQAKLFEVHCNLHIFLRQRICNEESSHKGKKWVCLSPWYVICRTDTTWALGMCGVTNQIVWGSLVLPELLVCVLQIWKQPVYLECALASNSQWQVVSVLQIWELHDLQTDFKLLQKCCKTAQKWIWMNLDWIWIEFESNWLQSDSNFEREIVVNCCKEQQVQQTD